MIKFRSARESQDAYMSLDLTANNDLSVEEEMLSKEGYHANRSEKAKSKGAFFKSKLVQSINDSGRFKSAVVDSEMKKIDPESDFPEELLQAYFDMMRAGIKARLVEDKDYKTCKGTGRFEHLDKL